MYAKALAHHEVGIHMLTTENSIVQKLKILQLGLPLDTKTQEGLAILSEYLSGNLSVDRLKELALRVLTVRHMIKFNDFRETFNYLCEEFNLKSDKAFNLCTRIYRGGGFTKDYLYLRGFKEIYNMYKNDSSSINELLIGKTSIEYKSIISELISREILSKPKYIPISYKVPAKQDNPILEYLLKIF